MRDSKQYKPKLLTLTKRLKGMLVAFESELDAAQLPETEKRWVQYSCLNPYTILREGYNALENLKAIFQVTIVMLYKSFHRFRLAVTCMWSCVVFFQTKDMLDRPS